MSAYPSVAAGAPINASTINDIILASINRPTCKLVLQANFNLAVSGTTYDITFGSGSEVRDDRSWHSISSNTNRVTPDLPGRYLVIANGYFAANATGDRRIYIAKNGAQTSIWGRTIANGSNGVTATADGVYECNGTTDYVGMQASQTSTAALNLQGAPGDTTFSTSLEVVYLGGLY